MAHKYITRSELDKYGISPNALGEVEEETIESMIELCTAEADSWIRTRYTAPLTEPIDLAIKKAVTARVVYDLLAHRGFSPDSDDDVVTSRNNAALNFYRSIANGMAQLDVTDAQTGDDPYPIASGDPSRGWNGSGRV